MCHPFRIICKHFSFCKILWPLMNQVGNFFCAWLILTIVKRSSISGIFWHRSLPFSSQVNICGPVSTRIACRRHIHRDIPHPRPRSQHYLWTKPASNKWQGILKNLTKRIQWSNRMRQNASCFRIDWKRIQ